MIQGSAADSRSAATRLIVAENPRLAEIAAEFCRNTRRTFPGPEAMRMSPETFRSRALECLRLAQDAGDSHHKSLCSAWPRQGRSSRSRRKQWKAT